jgi:hypothetical protein
MIKKYIGIFSNYPIFMLTFDYFSGVGNYFYLQISVNCKPQVSKALQLMGPMKFLAYWTHKFTTDWTRKLQIEPLNSG